MRKVASFLTGVFAGAVVGAVTAVLLAPSSGQELQDRVRTRVQELVEDGKRSAAIRRSELEAQLEAFKRGGSVTIDVTAGRPEA